MHPAIKEKLLWMKEERECCKGEYFATKYMYKGAKELAAEMQPVIDQLIAERDAALAELAALKASPSTPAPDDLCCFVCGTTANLRGVIMPDRNSLTICTDCRERLVDALPPRAGWVPADKAEPLR